MTREGYGILAIRILFFFLAAMVVNRFVVENRRQIKRYQELAETSGRNQPQAGAGAGRGAAFRAAGGAGADVRRTGT